MTRHRAATLAVLTFVAGLGLAGAVPRLDAQTKAIPERLTDEQFWKLSEELSEPGGYFRSDNLLSNEIWFQDTLNDLLRRTKPGGIYLGVGPEQNFTYIAALKPKMVFITDIRRGNLHTHLMYKALFEMSADRAEFVSRLFTKPRPAGLSAKSTASEIMNAYWDVSSSPDAVYKANLQAIKDHLTKKPHTLPLTKEDLDGIDYVYYNFYWFGPSITYNSTSANAGGRGGGNMTNFHNLMVSTDSAGGLNRTFLASEEHFKVLKDLEERNLLVPVVGNFGGPKALRAVGQYIRERGATVTAFYLSNVEQYLYMDGIWTNFCANVASMPLDEQSTFIRSSQGGGGGGGGLVNSLGSMRTETLGCVGRSPSGSSTAR